MKSIYLLLFLSIFPILVFSQNFVMTWNQCYGGSDEDNVKSIIPYKNGYLFLGSTQSNDGDVSNNLAAASAWLVNIDSVGNIIFDKCYEGFDWAHGNKILNIDTAGFYYLGSSGTNTGSIDGYWMAKADTNFNIIWQDVYGGSGQEMIRGGCLSHNGGIIEVGISASTDGDKEISYGFHDDWAVNLNPDGSKNWIKTYGNAAVNEGGNIIQTSDGGYMLTASGYNRLPGNIYCEGHDDFQSEAWAIKIDSDGEIEWYRCFGGAYREFFNNVIEIDGGYIFTGASMSADRDLPSHYGQVGESVDLWMCKTNSSGDVIWSKNYGGTDWDAPYKIFENTDNTYTILGITTSHDFDVQGNNASDNYYAVWMLKIDEKGELIYQKPFDELYPISDFPDFIRISDYKFIAAVTKQLDGCHGFSNEDIYIFEMQDLDEFIPSQAIGADRVCLGIETETYYSTNLVIDTMETQWLLEPAEAGSMTIMHDIVLIHWNIDFHDTAWLQVKAINEYGESSYSTPKEIIVYPALNLSSIIGPDSVCTVQHETSLYTIENENQLMMNWYLEPQEAGAINNLNDSAIINWNQQYEGLATLKYAAINKCETEEFSNPKELLVKTCVGIDELKYGSLKVYPNPSNDYFIFELPPSTKESSLVISDIYGKIIAELNNKDQQTQIIWNCRSFASGVYYYQTKIGAVVYRGKIIINE